MSMSKPEWILRFATHLHKVHPLLPGAMAAEAATRAFDAHGSLAPEHAAETFAEVLPPTDPDDGMTSDADA
jgi:hypothetical protein